MEGGAMNDATRKTASTVFAQTMAVAAMLMIAAVIVFMR
jgi:hypothetical protein